MKFILFFSLLIVLCISCFSQEWSAFTSPDKLFKIKSQGKPKVMKLDSMYGIDSTLIYTFKGTKNNAFMLTVQYFSNEKLKPEFNEEKRFEILKKYSEVTIGLIGEVIHSEKIFLSDHLGVYIKGNVRQATKPPYPQIYIKAYLVKNIIYQLMYTSGYESKEDKDKNVYFDSFEIL